MKAVVPLAQRLGGELTDLLSNELGIQLQLPCT